MPDSARPEFFSQAWWDAVAEEWNASGQTRRMALFGTAVLRATDAALPPVWLHWDRDGRLSRRASGRADDPDFAASLENWTGFFQGRFTAGMGLLRYRIRFQGPVRRVLPYVGGFNAFARVAGRV
jgi:hypothetical protein